MSALQEFEDRYVHPNLGRTLIVGSKIYNDKPDRRSLYKDVVGVDMLPGDGVDVVVDMEDSKSSYVLGEFEHVECMSVLEHSRKPWKMAETIESLMVPGATIFVSVPFCWRVHGYPSDYWRMTPEALRVLFPNIEWETLGFAGVKLRIDKERLDRHMVNDHPYFARTETVGFGRRL